MPPQNSLLQDGLHIPMFSKPSNIALTQGPPLSVMSVDGFDWDRCCSYCPITHYAAEVPYDVRHDGLSNTQIYLSALYDLVSFICILSALYMNLFLFISTCTFNWFMYGLSATRYTGCALMFLFLVYHTRVLHFFHIFLVFHHFNLESTSCLCLKSVI